MKQRPDSAVYAEALKELRRHHDEFEQIRKEMLAEAGLTVDSSLDDQSAERSRVAAMGYVTSYVESHDHRPTFREIGKAVGVSDNTARRYVHQLERDGDLVPAERACRYCGKSLEGRRSTARFCRDLCKSRFYNEVPRNV